MNKALMISTALAAGLFIASPAFAEVLNYKVMLDGTTQSPPADTKATATADVKIDTTAKTIGWTITSKDLTGPPTQAHFHGPAAKGATAAAEIDISKSVNSGSAQITDAQIADVKAGNVYLDIHTAKFPDGEVRGQLVQ